MLETIAVTATKPAVTIALPEAPLVLSPPEEEPSALTQALELKLEGFDTNVTSVHY